jgi:HK97 family phage portal protein
MSIFDKLFSRSVIKQPIPRSSYLFGIGGSIPPDRDAAGTLADYGSIGWLYAVVFRIALGCSEVKWTLFDDTNPQKPKQIFKHRILDLLDMVNPFQTSNEFIALDTIYEDLIGESFWAINFNLLGEPAEMALLYPHKVSVVPSRNFPFVKGYVYGSGQGAVPFDINEIIHFKYPNPLDQYRGLGPAQAIGVNLDSQKFMGEWNRQFFYNSARPDGVIQYDYNLSEEQFQKLKAQWNEKYRGVSKAHQVGLLEGGGKYLQIQNSVKDMDFGMLDKANRDVLLGVFGMPLSVMGISENVNKANAEAGEYTFARWIVKPRLEWKRAKLQEQLIPKFRDSQNLRIGFEEVVPQTLEQKRDLAESGMRAGYLLINEARKLNGLDPIPGGDMLLIPFNLSPTSPDKIEPKPEPAPIVPQDQPPADQPKGKGLSSDQKKVHWEAYSRRLDRYELMFERVFGIVFDEHKAVIISSIETTNKLPLDLDDGRTAKKFEPAIMEVYHSAFENAIPKGVKQIDDFARAWIAKRSLDLAASVNSTLLNELRSYLMEGFAEGESIQQLTKRISGWFTDNEKWKAERVARTETASASFEGTLRRYQLEGVEQLEFYPAPDACEECMDVFNAQPGGIYDIKSADNLIPVHCNCRCTALAVIT